MKFIKITVILLVALAFAGTVTTPDNALGEGFLSAPWRFNVNLYGWLPEAPATIEVGGEEVADVDEDLDTILDSMNFAAMFELEVHKGPVVVFANTVYYTGKYDKNFTGVISGERRKFELDEEVWLVKYAVGYQLGPWSLGKSPASPTLTVYPYAGALYFHDDWSVKISPGGAFDGVKNDGTLEFNTPIVGLSPRLKLSERWYLMLSLSYGGWDVDDVNKTYDFIGDIGYRFKMWNVSSKVYAGYRYLNIEYEKKPVKLEVDVKGPFFGIGWEF